MEFPCLFLSVCTPWLSVEINPMVLPVRSLNLWSAIDISFNIFHSVPLIQRTPSSISLTLSLDEDISNGAIKYGGCNTDVQCQLKNQASTLTCTITIIQVPFCLQRLYRIDILAITSYARVLRYDRRNWPANTSRQPPMLNHSTILQHIETGSKRGDGLP